jgi:hypothetical protein
MTKALTIAIGFALLSQSLAFAAEVTVARNAELRVKSSSLDTPDEVHALVDFTGMLMKSTARDPGEAKSLAQIPLATSAYQEARTENGNKTGSLLIYDEQPTGSGVRSVFDHYEEKFVPAQTVSVPIYRYEETSDKPSAL